MNSMRMLVRVGWIALFAMATPSQSQEKKLAGKGIDPATIAAYEKLGAEYQPWLKVGVRAFDSHLPPPADGVPGFFVNNPNAKLFNVNVPFGLSFFGMTDAWLKELAGLNNLTALNLGTGEVTDAGLKELRGLKNLTSLGLQLAAIKGLGVLYLSATKITDAGLKELVNFENLTSLDLRNTKITDAGLKELARLARLSDLYLGGTKVTDAGVAELRKALPRCGIHN